MNQSYDAWNEYVEKTHNIPSPSGLPSHNPYPNQPNQPWPPNSPQPPQPQPQPQPQPHQQQPQGTAPGDNGGGAGDGGNRTALWLAVVLLVALVASWGLFYFLGGKDVINGNGGNSGNDSGGGTVTSAEDSQSAEQPPKDDDAQDSSSVDSSTAKPSQSSKPSQSTQPTSSPGRPPQQGDDNLAEHITTRGWVDTPGATCNGTDEWVFAGQGSGNKVVICRVGQAGGLYYRGHVNGGDWEQDVDMNASNVAGKYFEIPSTPDLIIVSANGVKVERNGQTILDSPFTETYPQ